MRKKLLSIILVLATLLSLIPVNTGLATSYITGTINADGVAFRSEPSSDGSRMKKLNKGDKVEIITTNVNAQWHKVKYNGETGYVNRVYVDLQQAYDSSYQATVVNVEESVNVRSKPSRSGEILGAAKLGETFTLKDPDPEEGWYQIEYKKKTGYVNGDYLQIAPKAGSKQLSSISVVGGTLSPAFSPETYGYVVVADRSDVKISVTAPKGTKVSIGESGKSTYTVSMPKRGSKTVRITVAGKVRYSLYIVRKVITVGTYNIKRGYSKDGQSNNLTEMGELVKAQQPDLLGVQEAYISKSGSTVVNNLVSLKTKKMDKYAFSETITYSSSAQYGVGILSAYDIISSDSTKLYSEGVEQRVLQKIVVNIGGKKVSVYNTHLSYENATIREKQFTEIKKIMDRDKNKYKILFGDFNCKSNEFDILRGDYTVLNGSSTEFFDYDGTLIEKNEIDNIIVSNNILVCNVRMINKKLSDHMPVFAYLILN